MTPQTQKTPQSSLYAPQNVWKLLNWSPNSDAQREMLSVIKLPYPGLIDGEPYPRIFPIVTGRQLGKTTAEAVLFWQGMTAKDDHAGPPTVRLTADTEEHGFKVWDKITYAIDNTPIGQLVKSNNKDRKLITLHTGATGQLLSANNPSTLAGDTVSLYIIEESQYFSKEAYTNLEPTTVVRQGIIAMFGVAQGSGPFREAAWRGERDNRHIFPQYLKLRYPSRMNPLITEEALRQARAEHTQDDYNALYEAIWTEEANQVFSGVRDIIDLGLGWKPTEWGAAIVKPPLPGRSYYAGLDVARSRDWTVYAIFDRDGTLVAWDRFSRMRWDDQRNRLVKLRDMYRNPLVVVDSTTLGGQIVFDDLAANHFNARDYAITSNEKKREIIGKLALRIEKRQLRLPNIPQAVSELERYERKRSKIATSDVVRYGAPEGANDDFVMALALAMDVLPRPMWRLASDVRDAIRQAYDTADVPDAYRQVGVWERIGH